MGQVRHDHARRQSSNTAIASFARAVEPGTRHQPEDGGEVAQAGDGRGHEDRAFGIEVAAVIDPASDAVSASPMPTASWHLAPAGCRGRQTQAPEVQALSDRVLPHRHCRGSDG